MSYGIWLYKEIINDSGRKTRLEIEKRDYAGAAIEIGALSGDIVLSIDTDSPTAPIVKSNLSFAIIDTEQVTYSDFFTPDATLYRVKVYDVDGQTQTIRWTGFVTPDSFAEPLEYRSAINLTARDNLGYLNDLEFDLGGWTDERYASIKSIINAALSKIGHGSAAGGMSVSWNVAKKAATASGGTFDNIEDAIVSTYTMLGDTWGNVVEALLKGIGCQLRYIDGNSFAVYDVEALSDSATFAAQQVQFLNKSGYREIQPAWKRGIFSQDYQLNTEMKMPVPSSYSGIVVYQQMEWFRLNYRKYMVMRNTAVGWTVQNGSIQSPVAWGLASPYDVNGNSVDLDAVYIPFFECTDAARKGIYAQKGVNVSKIDNPISLSFVVNPHIKLTAYSDTSQHTEVYGLLVNEPSPSRLQNRTHRYFHYNIVLVGSNGTTYFLRDTWQTEGQLEEPWRTIDLPETVNGDLSDIDVSCKIITTPCSGLLALRIYAPSGTFTVPQPYRTAVFHNEICIKVSGMTVETELEQDGGRSRQGLVNNAHNVTGSDDYIFGQVPVTYGIEFFKGGIYKNDTPYTPYAYFKRTATATETNNLLDLIGRETIQYHKKSFNLLSGTVQVLTRTSLMTFGTLSYGGKRYLPLSAALNMLENTISITSMLEIENYVEEAGIVFSDYVGKNSYSGKSGYSGGGGSSGGSSVSQHGQLAGRDAADSHPMSAITGLSDALAGKVASQTINEIRVVNQYPATMENGVLYIKISGS